MRTARSSSRLRGGGMSASVHAGIHPHPQVWAWRTPLGVGLETSPGVDLENPPPSQTSQPSPWVWAWRPPPARPLNLPPPGCGPGDLPPCEQNSWHTLLKILPCPNFVAGGNNVFNNYN